MSRASEDDAVSAKRRDAMRIMASAPAGEMSRLFREGNFDADARILRGPETGLVTVRGRIGGAGAPFNVGEATVTRASVRLSTGETGHAYAFGRDGEKVRLAAIIDALLQRHRDAEAVEAAILAPLRAAHREAADRRKAETAATKVDFFTVVRGED